LAIAKPEGAGAATITGVPEGVKASGTWAEKTAEPEVTPTAGGETTKAYSATITLEAAEAGKVVFDTAIAAADFKGVTDVTIVEGSVKATAEKVTFDVSAEVTEGGGDQETPAIKVSAPADVVVDTAAQTATVVDLSATLSNAGTIADGTKMTWTAEATGITGDVKFGTDEATAETTGSSDITASNGETSIKMFVPAGEVGTIKVTAKCTVDEKEIAADPVEVKLAAKADENTVAEKLKAVEDGMKSDAASPKTVDLLVTDNATTIGEKVAEVAKTLVDGYDVTFAANDVTLDEETTTVTGKFTVQQSGNTDPSLAKTSASDITVKVAVKKAPIETVAISLTAPADGVAIANATTTGTGYAVKSTTWKEVGGANDMVTGDTFAAGAAYQATVVLEASTGYTFNAETAKTDVTGAKTTAINPAITADATELTLVVTYDALPDDGGDPEGTGIEITLGSDTGFTLNSAKDGITVASTATAKTVEALLAAVSVTVDGEADASATKKVYEIADDTDKTETEKTTGNLTTGWVLRVTSSADPTVTKDYAITVNGSDEGEAKEVTIAEGSGAGDAGITVSGTTTKEITIANVTTTPATLISNLTITVGGTALDNTSTVKVYGDTSGKANKEDEKTAALTEGTYWLCVPNGGADNATTDFKITVSDGNTEKTISLIEDITLDAAYIPEGGKVVPATAQEVTGTGYTATVTYEESKNTGNFADVDGTKYFKPSTAYVATVTITPDTTGGYSFADDFSGKVTVKLGSEDSTGTEVTLADGASGVKTGTATFAATEAASAAITTTPTDLTGTTTAKFEKTITIQLTGDAFKAVENDDTAIASLFEITDLPSGFTATVNQVSAGANEAVIKIVSDSETPSVLTKTSSITVKVLSTALISEKADLTITDGFTIEITQG